MSKGTLYVFSAPSGCGKGTVLKELFKKMPGMYYSVSATTREPREGEQDGINYFFVSKEEFKKLIDSDGMLEYATYCGNYYGTPKKRITDYLEQGTDVVLEIETAGAMMVKAVYPEAVMIFMLPPSVDDLRKRLVGRGTDSAEVIEKRVSEASREIRLSANYDFLLINDDLSETVDTLCGIMKYSKNLTKINKDIIKGVLEKC